jgi:hypothetical protein
MYQLLRIAQLVGLNAIPGFGFLKLHWSAGTVIALYWVENLFGSVLVAMRIDLHRRLTHKQGHYAGRNGGTFTVEINGKKTYPKISAAVSFLLVSLVFTLAEGIFLIFLLGALPDADHVNFDALRLGVRLVGGFLAAGFLFDLIGIRERPFFWIYRITNSMLSRVFVLFFVVYIGIFAIVFFNAPRSAIVVFIVLKTVIDIASQLPESQTGEAPQYQLAIAGLFGPNAREKWAKYSRDANREYGTYSPDDEKVMERA